MIARQIGRNCIEPGFEEALSRIGALLQHMQQGFLYEILGQWAITTDQPIEIAEQGRMMARHQHGQRRLIACQDGSHQLFVASPLQSIHRLAPLILRLYLARVRATKGSLASVILWYYLCVLPFGWM